MENMHTDVYGLKCLLSSSVPKGAEFSLPVSLKISFLFLKHYELIVLCSPA